MTAEVTDTKSEATKTKPAKKSAAKKPAKAKANSKTGATPEWRKVLNAIAKTGAGGANGEQIAKFCERFGTRPFFARFVRAGYLKRVGRGQYAITAAGEKFLANRD